MSSYLGAKKDHFIDGGWGEIKEKVLNPKIRRQRFSCNSAPDSLCNLAQITKKTFKISTYFYNTDWKTDNNTNNTT